MGPFSIETGLATVALFDVCRVLGRAEATERWTVRWNHNETLAFLCFVCPGGLCTAKGLIPPCEVQDPVRMLGSFSEAYLSDALLRAQVHSCGLRTSGKLERTMIVARLVLGVLVIFPTR